MLSRLFRLHPSSFRLPTPVYASGEAMSLLPIALIVVVVLSIAYFTYGRLLPRLFNISDDRPTPAVEMRDDEDFIPTEKKFLLGQHFSAIAAAGPIVGP